MEDILVGQRELLGSQLTSEPLSRRLASIDTPVGRGRFTEYLKTQPFPHYTKVADGSGLVARTDSDGTRTVGRFVDRVFVPKGTQTGKNISAGNCVLEGGKLKSETSEPRRHTKCMHRGMGCSPIDTPLHKCAGYFEHSFGCENYVCENHALHSRYGTFCSQCYPAPRVFEWRRASKPMHPATAVTPEGLSIRGKTKT